MKLKIISFIVVLGFGIYSIKKEMNRVEKLDRDVNSILDSFDLELEGIIESTKILSGDYGVLNVSVVKSNYKDFGNDYGQKAFYCRVNDDKAQIIETGLSQLIVGDKIRIDGIKKRTTFLREGREILVRNIRIVSFEQFWDTFPTDADNTK